MNTTQEITTIEQECRRAQFARGPIRIPLPINGDAYTVAGEALASKDMLEKSTYGITFRTSPKDAEEFEGAAKDDRILLYGVSDFIREHLTDPITHADIDAAEEFMKTTHAFGGPLPFNRKTWERIVKEYGGYLPIKIDALPEGSTLYPGEPVVQVTSLDEGFGEIAATIEANILGQVAIATGRLTLERHILERMKEYVREDNPHLNNEEVIAQAQIMVHDFGMRASSTNTESALLGKAHLLCFSGTDTFNAAYQAWEQNERKPVGTSILALAHRTVQGSPTEGSAFNKLRHAAGEGGIGSYVGDCYNFENAIDDLLVPMAKGAAETDKGIIVARPDSGDYVESVQYIVNAAHEAGLSTIQANGRIAMTNLRYIQGDSMSWKKTAKVMDTLKENGYSPVNCGIFGVGGWLRNTPTRDTLSAAYKLMSKGAEETPVVKLSGTRAKMSVPGPAQVLRGIDAESASTRMHYEQPENGHNAIVTFYDGRMLGFERFRDPCLESFATLKDRVINEFDQSPLHRRVLSDEIIGIQNETMQAHGRSLDDYKF